MLKMNKFSAFFQRKSVKYAIPFFLVIVGGSFGLREFARIRYDFTRSNPIRKEAKRLGLELNDPKDLTLEKQYEKIKEMDIDNWEQIRGPRPWEENFNEEDE